MEGEECTQWDGVSVVAAAADVRAFVSAQNCQAEAAGRATGTRGQTHRASGTSATAGRTFDGASERRAAAERRASDAARQG